MSSIPSIVPLLPPAATPLSVGAVAAAAPVALTRFDGGELPLPVSQPLVPTSAAQAEPGPDGLAMRPDQVFLARQMHFQAGDGRTLATSWQAMVHQYGKQITERELRAHAGQLPPAILAAHQEGRVLRQVEHPLFLQDAWRFTVHAGGQKDQHLGVVQEQPDGASGRRKRSRAALRLELELADGTAVVVQVEPVPGGLAVELCAPGAAALERLLRLRPELEEAIARAGLQVLRWRYRDSLPLASLHARMASSDVVQVLTPAVFRAVAELALVLPRDGTPPA